MTEIAIKAVKAKPAKKEVSFSDFLYQSIDELVQDVRFTSSNLIAANVVGSNIGKGLGRFSINFIYSLVPEVRNVFYTFREITAEKLDKTFAIPFPNRYLSIPLSFSSTTSNYGGKTEIAVSYSAKIGFLLYSALHQHDLAKQTLNLKSHIGSFLSNSRFYNSDLTFCSAWGYNKNYKTHTKDHLTEAIYQTLQNYYWSQYNNHWFENCLRSPSIFLMMRDLSKGIKFEGVAFQKMQKLSKTKLATHDGYIKSAYFAHVYGLQQNEWNNHPSISMIKDYYKLLEALQKVPDYWNNLSEKKHIVAPLGGLLNSFYQTKNLIYFNAENPKAFVDSLHKALTKA